MANGVTVPQDILTDVLSRLPVKSLFRFKCVSHSWKALISSPHFALAHLNRTNANNPKHLEPNIILISTSYDLYFVNLAADAPIATKLDFRWPQQPEKNRVENVGACNGLYLVSISDSDYFVLNPSIRECKKLPRLPFVLNGDVCEYGLGYDSSRDEYKVVMLSFYEYEYESDYESESYTARERTSVAVYSLKTNAWRRIQDGHFMVVDAISGIYFNGCIHWLCRKAGSFLIVAFDLTDEIFREVPSPASIVDEEITLYQVMIVGDCLGLVSTLHRSEKEVWMMKEYGVRESWTKILFNPHGMYIWGMLGLLEEDEFVLIIHENILQRFTKDKLVVYNTKKGTLKDIVICGTPAEFHVLCTYVENLVSPNQWIHAGGTGKQG